MLKGGGRKEGRQGKEGVVGVKYSNSFSIFSSNNSLYSRFSFRCYATLPLLGFLVTCEERRKKREEGKERKMDEIEQVVAEIIKGVAAATKNDGSNVATTSGERCSEILAAFVARTILESDSVTFALDKDLTDDDVNKVSLVILDSIHFFLLLSSFFSPSLSLLFRFFLFIKVISLSISRILEKDSPSLETIKMQVAFDSSHVTETSALDKAEKVTEGRFR